MAIRNPESAAARVKTPVAAARLNDELETELAMGDPDAVRAAALERARADLAGRFGGYDNLHQVDTSNRRTGGPGGPYMRKKANGPPHSGRRRPGGPSSPSSGGGSGGSKAAPGRGGQAAGRAPAPRSPAPRRTTRPSRPRTARAFRQTGIPGAAGSTTALVLNVLGLMIGLSLLYLVLTNAERAGKGGGVVGQTLGIVTGAIGAIVSPRDPLTPSSSAGAAPGSSGVTAGSAGLDTQGEIGGFPRAGGPTGTRTQSSGVTTP